MSKRRSSVTKGESVEFFKAEDFWRAVKGNCEIYSGRHPALGMEARVVAEANRLLSERGVKVYGSPAHGMPSPGPIAWGHDKRITDTHQALLVGIEPIAKEDSEIRKRIAEINRLSKEIEVLIENNKS